MGPLRRLWQPPIDGLALEADRAGAALACPFSSSDEYEAAIIRGRRAAGMYGVSRRQRLMAAAVVASLVAVLLFAAL